LTGDEAAKVPVLFVPAVGPEIVTRHVFIEPGNYFIGRPGRFFLEFGEHFALAESPALVHLDLLAASRGRIKVKREATIKINIFS
jgi:hypothetical protein